MQQAIETPSILAPVSTPAFAIRDLSFFVLAITAAILGEGRVTIPLDAPSGRRRGTPPVEDLALRADTLLSWTDV